MFTPLFSTPAMPLHLCSIHQQCLYTLVQHISNAFTSLFNIPAIRVHPCSTNQQYIYTIVQQTNSVQLHPSSANQRHVQFTPFFNNHQRIWTFVQRSAMHWPRPLSFLFEKVVVCGHCLVTLSITSYWNIKMALVAVHLNAGVILVVTV